MAGIFALGGVLVGVGLVIWAVSTNFVSIGWQGSNSSAQLLGIMIGLMGAITVVVGWGAVAVCRQVVDERTRTSSRQS